MGRSGGFVAAERVVPEGVPVPEAFADKVKVPPGELVTNRSYFSGSADGEPEGFLVEMPAPCVAGAHFHEVDQFQLFLPGGGTWYQRHDVDRLLVHYTDAFTAYGPFGSRGPEPLLFFTLRPIRSQVTGYLPEDRDLLVRRGRRNYKVDLALDDRPGPGDVIRREVFAPEADGLVGNLLSLGPDTPFDVPERGTAASSGGRYACVVRGSLAAPGRPGPWSLAWAPPGGSFGSPRAGEDGADVLVLQFPAQDPVVDGSDRS